MGLLKEVLGSLGSDTTAIARELWEFDAQSPILCGSELVLDNKGDVLGVVLATKSGKVTMLDLKGSPRWSWQINEKISKVDQMFLDEDNAQSITAKPAVGDVNRDGRPEIFVTSEFGSLYCIDLSGKLIWSFKAKAQIRTTPLIADVNNDGELEVIFGSNDKYLYALSKQGEIKWAFLADAEIEGSAEIIQTKWGTQIIFGTNDGTVYSLDHQGRILWRFKAKNKITAKPVCARIYGDEKIFIIFGSHDGTMYVLTEQGVLDWSFKTSGKINSMACVKDINSDGKLEIIFGSCDDNVYLLSAMGGKIWNFETDFWVNATPIAADVNKDNNTEIIVGSFDKKVYVLSGVGEYHLDYFPGVGTAISQPTSGNNLMMNTPGSYLGSVLCSFKAHGMVVGISYVEKQSLLLVATNTGILSAFSLSR